MREPARDVRIVRLPRGDVPLGALAGVSSGHPFAPDGHTGTSCVICFGWSSDYRHHGFKPLTAPAVT